MTLPIEFTFEAREEYNDAIDWYASRSAMAPTGFEDATSDALKRIANDPDRFPKSLAGCRRCALKGYPFNIMFYATADRIIVVAVAHSKRRPGYWKKRLE
jgi:toxin ParE1/3/4